MSKTAALQINLYGLKHILTDMIQNITAGNYVGVFGNCTLGLFTAWPGWSADIQKTDLTEADFTGYVQQTVTFSTPYENSDDEAAMTTGDHVFRPTDAVTPNTVIGAFIEDDDNNLVCAGVFDEVIPMNNDQDQASIIATILFDALAEYGNSIAVD